MRGREGEGIIRSKLAANPSYAIPPTSKFAIFDHIFALFFGKTETIQNIKKSLAQEVRQKSDISEHRSKG